MISKTRNCLQPYKAESVENKGFGGRGKAQGHTFFGGQLIVQFWTIRGYSENRGQNWTITFNCPILKPEGFRKQSKGKSSSHNKGSSVVNFRMFNLYFKTHFGETETPNALRNRCKSHENVQKVFQFSILRGQKVFVTF